MKTTQNTTRWLGLVLACGTLTFAATAQAGKPVKPPEPPPAPTVQYQLIDIGVGGPLAGLYEVTAINAGGVVIGNAGLTWARWPAGNMSFADFPYLIEPETDGNGAAIWFRDDGAGNNALITYLPGIDEALAVEAMCINNEGVIAGIANFFDGENEPIGYLVCWVDGNIHLLDVGVDCWQVRSLTRTGQLLVENGTGSLLLRLGVADDGTVFIAESAALAPNLGARSVNGAGDLVGHDYDTGHAFLMRNAGSADAQLISLATADSSSARDINEAGIIVGSAGHSSNGQGGNSLACEWVVAADGTVTATELSGLPGISGKWTSYSASSVNVHNQIVGEYSYYEGNKRHGNSFYWENGTMHDLSSLLVDSPSNVTLIGPDGINTDGVIVGRYRRTDGEWRDCVLVPMTP